MFYKVKNAEGEILQSTEDILSEDVTVEPFYIHTLNKGTSGYTEYEINPEDILEVHGKMPELRDCLIGHIHSHHNMNVYFSGTDDDQLYQGGLDYELFFSLIVNNKMETCASFSFKGERQNKITFSFSENTLEETETVVYKQVIETEIEEEVFDVPEMFQAQIEEICKPKTPVYNGLGFQPRHPGSFDNRKLSEKYSHGELKQYAIIQKAMMIIRDSLKDFIKSNESKTAQTNVLRELWQHAFRICKANPKKDAELLEFVTKELGDQYLKTDGKPGMSDQSFDHLCNEIFAKMDAMSKGLMTVEATNWLKKLAIVFAEDFLMEEEEDLYQDQVELFDANDYLNQNYYWRNQL